MIAEAGQLALTFAFALSLLLAIVPLYGSFTARQNMLLLAKPLAFGQFIFSFLAMAALSMLHKTPALRCPGIIRSRPVLVHMRGQCCCGY